MKGLFKSETINHYLSGIRHIPIVAPYPEFNTMSTDERMLKLDRQLEIGGLRIWYFDCSEHLPCSNVTQYYKRMM